MKPLLVILSVLLIGFTSVYARTITIPDENIAFDVPDDWQQIGHSGMLFCATSGPYLVQLLKSTNPRNYDLESNIIAQIKSGMQRNAERSGSQLSFGDEGSLTVGGVPAYLIEGSQASGAKTVQVSLYAIDANRSIYELILLTAGTMPDATLQGVVDSFHFTSPPALPESIFQRRALKVGIAAGVLLVLVAIAAGIWLAVRRR